MLGISFDMVKGFLVDVAKDFLNETAFDQFGRLYASICTKFAREYLEEGSGVPPKFLKRFRRRFYRIARLSVIVVDEIDSLVGDRPIRGRVDKFEDLFGDGGYGGNSSAVIEIKAKQSVRRKKRVSRVEDPDEDD